jgi:hypothetical protein
LIKALIKQQAEAKEQARRVDEQLLQLLNANKKHNIRKSKRIVDEIETEEDDVVVKKIDNDYIKKHNIRKSKYNESEKETKTEEEDITVDEDNNTDDEDNAVDDDDDESIVKKNRNNKTKLTPYKKKNINNKYDCVTYNDYEYMTRERDDYIEVKLPWLEFGYDWNALLSDHQDGSNKKKKEKINTS